VYVITDDRCTGYESHGHPERPERITATVARLRAQTELDITWLTPEPIPDEILLRTHSAAYLGRLRAARDFDADTPWFPQIESVARLSAGAALLALEHARAGQPVFSLMRPPGHHATHQHPMGFCYLNNAAIATHQARQQGVGRVAVFDFDVHHGNGTEEFLRDLPGTGFFSVHEYPCYPGTGAARAGTNCFNYPVAPHSSREIYRAVLGEALDDLCAFRPDLIVVSAGFDAYAHDPLANSPLLGKDFHWLGLELRRSGAPMLSLLEGGYSNALPELIFAYLKGLAGRQLAS